MPRGLSTLSQKLLSSFGQIAKLTALFMLNY